MAVKYCVILRLPADLVRTGDFAVRTGDFVEGSGLLVCGCLTAGGDNTRSATATTCGEFGESEGEGVSKTPPSGSN
jgi:hypothetical protein